METRARVVTVVYHYEDGLWWSESDDVPEFTGGGDTFEEARRLTLEGLAFTLDQPVDLDERFDEAAMSARRAATRFSSPASTLVFTGSTSGNSAQSVPVEPIVPGVASSTV